MENFLEEMRVEAASNGQLEMVQLLVALNTNINAKNSSKDSALNVACQLGLYEIVKCLLGHPGHHADIDSKNSRSKTPLLEALFNQHFEIAELLIARGANVDCWGADRVTPLHLAAFHGNLSIAKMLIINRNCDTNKLDHDGSSPLHDAISGNHKLNIVRFLSDYCDVNLANHACLTPLSLAAANGRLDIIKLLVAKGADIKHEIKGFSPVLEAVKEKHVDVVKYLIKRGADINATDDDEHSLLFWALHSSEIVKFLVDREIQVNTIGDAGVTPLCAAVEMNDIEIVRILLDNGAYVNLATRIARTPEFRDFDFVEYLLSTHTTQFYDKPSVGSIPNNNFDLFQYLTTCKGYVNLLTKAEVTPVLVASYSGNSEMIKLLKSRGADINLTTTNGCTPLHTAICRGDYNVVKTLTDLKADVNINDNIRRTPLFLAAQEGHLAIVAHLVDKVEDINARSIEGLTPLLAAAVQNHEQVVKFLIVCGADVNAVNYLSRNILHFAALNGLIQTTRLCVCRGVNVNQVDALRKTPLFYAYYGQHVAVFNFLKACGGIFNDLPLH